MSSVCREPSLVASVCRALAMQKRRLNQELRRRNEERRRIDKAAV